MLSAVIITKNEEANIGRCLTSVREIADEIIVVDSGSTDRTVDIARNLGAQVHHQDWLGFDKQRNHAASLARMDYILFLDADEEVSGDLRSSIREALANRNCAGWKIHRKTYYLGKVLHHAWHHEWLLRLVKRGEGRFEGDLHEKMICKGKVGRVRGLLFHYSYKNLTDQMNRLVGYARQSALIMEKRGRKFYLFNLILNPMWAFFKVFLRGGFMEGYRGILIAVFEATYTFLKYAFLLERKLQKKNPKLWM
ncbi:MAG: glycosyltransferase family 2 protein [Syntrophobacterales bacterium]|jgi:glycosyltransferase involved in cell wall biosynthesis|nr:glycosyltransferase family 2 protein [Syntrophobacterales bacterium]